MSNHTPEPWFDDRATHDEPYQNIKILGDENRGICWLWIDDAPVDDWNSEQRANARRIVTCVNACAGMADPAAEIAELKALSVKNILLDVTPGDGSGLEVYAKSVADVSDLLSKMDEEIAELKRQRDELLGLVKAVSYHSIPATVDGIKCAAFPWAEYESMVIKAKGSAS